MIKTKLSGTLLALCLCWTAAAKPLDDALNASNRGDYRTAISILQPLAEAGNAEAQFFLAMTYEEGVGGARGLSQAVGWYRRAADQGYAHAEMKLAEMYRHGKGVQRNYEEAAKWYRKIADSAYGTAHYHLGVMYATGEGVPQDLVEAYKWLTLACCGPSLGLRERAPGLKEEVLAKRDEIGRKMTETEIDKATRLAAEWKPK